jgi:acyl carrier protein
MKMQNMSQSATPYIETVTEAARNLRLLDSASKLVVLDSLSILDLITELETVTKLSIPTAEIRDEVFKSIETVAELLGRLSKGPAASSSMP